MSSSLVKVVRTQLSVKFSVWVREPALENVWSAPDKLWRAKRGCVLAFFQAVSVLAYSRNSLAV